MAFLLASATALLTAAPTLYEALWPLAWVALVPLFLALRGASPKRALLLGWWAETLMYWVGFYWLIGTMVHFGFIPVPLSVCFFALIGLGNGIRLGLFACWLRWTERLAPPWWVRLVLPACTYVAFDYLFPRVFPWYLGFLQLPGLPFIQIADVTGVHGVTFVLVVCNTVVAGLRPTSYATGARRASHHGSGLCQPPPAARGVWPLAPAAADRGDAAGTIPAGSAHPAQYRHVREAQRC